MPCFVLILILTNNSTKCFMSLSAMAAYTRQLGEPERRHSDMVKALTKDGDITRHAAKVEGPKVRVDGGLSREPPIYIMNQQVVVWQHMHDFKYIFNADKNQSFKAETSISVCSSLHGCSFGFLQCYSHSADHSWQHRCCHYIKYACFSLSLSLSPCRN